MQYLSEWSISRIIKWSRAYWMALVSLFIIEIIVIVFFVTLRFSNAFHAQLLKEFNDQLFFHLSHSVIPKELCLVLYSISFFYYGITIAHHSRTSKEFVGVLTDKQFAIQSKYSIILFTLLYTAIFLSPLVFFIVNSSFTPIQLFGESKLDLLMEILKIIIPILLSISAALSISIVSLAIDQKYSSIMISLCVILTSFIIIMNETLIPIIVSAFLNETANIWASEVISTIIIESVFSLLLLIILLYIFINHKVNYS